MRFVNQNITLLGGSLEIADEFLKHEERSALIGMLLKLPNKEKFTVRTNLLSYIQSDIRNSIERDGAPKQDFQNIMSCVDDEEWDHPPDASYPLFTLLTNAIDHVGVSSSLGLQIVSFRPRC